MVYHHDGGNSITQRLCWDEINRLIATSDGSQISHYIYDANGERAMKYNGTLSKIQQNKYTLVDCASMGQFTYYINPLMTVSTQEYTKHYFIEGQRVMSKIGAGMANNLMDMEDGAYDYIMSALSDSIKNQLAASFECLSLDGIAVFNTSMEPILEMANQNNHEFLCYFYHPDHLGSSSFITGATGEPTQHLEYLPFGELFIEERSTWNTPYKFSAKELDDETGYSYFGARYYDPNISIWLSVDPLSDIYPSTSPYLYVRGNPMNLTDPNGMNDDGFTVDDDGYVKRVDNTGGDNYDVLYEDEAYNEGKRDYDETGKKSGMLIRDTEILPSLEKQSGKKDPWGSNQVSFSVSTNRYESFKAFYFLSNNSDVEWAIDGYVSNGSFTYVLATAHDINHSVRTDSEYLGLGLSLKQQNFAMHSHPNTIELYSGGDQSVWYGKYKRLEGYRMPAKSYVYNVNYNTLTNYDAWNARHIRPVMGPSDLYRRLGF